MFVLGDKIQEAKLRLQMSLAQIRKEAGVDSSFLDDLMWGGKPQQLPEGTTYEEACRRVATALKLDPEEFWAQAQLLPDVRPEPFGVTVEAAMNRLGHHVAVHYGKGPHDPESKELAEWLMRRAEDLMGWRQYSLK